MKPRTRMINLWMRLFREMKNKNMKEIFDEIHRLEGAGLITLEPNSENFKNLNK